MIRTTRAVPVRRLALSRLLASPIAPSEVLLPIAVVGADPVRPPARRGWRLGIGQLPARRPLRAVQDPRPAEEHHAVAPLDRPRRQILVSVGDHRRDVLLPGGPGAGHQAGDLRQRPHRRRADAHHARSVGRASTSPSAPSASSTTIPSSSTCSRPRTRRSRRRTPPSASSSRSSRAATAAATPRTKKKMFHFQYDVATQTLRLLEDYEAPDNHPGWASVSPDTTWVVFSREANLWAMTYGEYKKILDARRGKTGAAADSADWKVEGGGGPAHHRRREGLQLRQPGPGRERRRDRQGVQAAPARGHRLVAGTRSYFALTREDQRKVGDLWVIHSTGNKRPQLETYKYDMPGEKNVTQTELLVFDMQSRQMKKIDDDPWKDETMGVYRQPQRPGGLRGFGGGERQRRAAHLAGGSPTSPTSSTSSARAGTCTAST